MTTNVLMREGIRGHAASHSPKVMASGKQVMIYRAILDSEQDGMKCYGQPLKHPKILRWHSGHFANKPSPTIPSMTLKGVQHDQ